MEKIVDQTVFNLCAYLFFSSPEPKKAWDELIGWDSSHIRPFTLSNINISETSGPIIIKFHLEHHWGGGLVALGFGPDRIRTLVSWQQIAPMGLEWGKPCDLSFSFIFIGSSLFLQVTRTTITSWMC